MQTVAKQMELQIARLSINSSLDEKCRANLLIMNNRKRDFDAALGFNYYN